MKLVPFGSVIHETLWDVMFSSLLDLFFFTPLRIFEVYNQFISVKLYFTCCGMCG